MINIHTQIYDITIWVTTTQYWTIRVTHDDSHPDFAIMITREHLKFQYHLWCWQNPNLTRTPYIMYINADLDWTTITNLNYKNIITSSQSLDISDSNATLLQYEFTSLHSTFHSSQNWPQIRQLNSLWPSDGIWQHKSGSTLVQVMAWCLLVPSHCLNQSWLIISEVQ